VYWSLKRVRSTKKEKTDNTIFVFVQKISVALIFGGMLLVFLGCLYLMDVTSWPLHLSALSVGLALIAVGCFFLVGYLPFVADKWEASVSIFAQKGSFALIIGGLILVILLFLNLMNVIPWWSFA